MDASELFHGDSGYHRHSDRQGEGAPAKAARLFLFELICSPGTRPGPKQLDVLGTRSPRR